MGAFVVCTLLYYVVIAQPQVQENYESLGKYMFDNIKSESERVASIILLENRSTENTIDRMRSYAGFLDAYSAGHNANITYYFLSGVQDDNLNITFGNYKGGDIGTLWINVNGTAKSMLDTEDRTMQTVQFGPVTNQSLFSYNFTFNNTYFNDSFYISNRPFALFDIMFARGMEVWANTVKID